MRALVIAEKKAQGEPFVKSLEERGIRAQYIRVSRISLVSVENKTLIKVKGKELPRFDAVFFQVRPSLAPFLEPLIEAFKSTGAFLSATESSFYSSFNEPYQFVILAMNDVPTPRTLTSGSGKSIEKISSKISYPLILQYLILQLMLMLKHR